jgi:DNA-binding transcriptional LysR family regulator
MIAVRIGTEMRMAIVESPGYFANRPVPKTPQDLAAHSCINLRLQSGGGFYVWELEKDGRKVNVRVDGQVAFNDVEMVVRSAEAGLGLGFVMEDQVAAQIESGALIRVLDDWCAPFAGYHLYYPSRRQPSAAFTLLVDALRFRG